MKPVRPRNQGEHFWPKMVLRKWLNINANDRDFSADEGDTDSDCDSEETREWEQEDEQKMGGYQDNCSKSMPYRSRRRKSETLRAQYINTRELRICIGTWNVGGKLPPDDLDIEEWLDMDGPADIYVLGLQEIVPLNAGNIFGPEDNRPVPRWEYLIRESLNRIQPVKAKYKCYSDPPSPSRFMPSDDALISLDELLPETDSDDDDKVHPLDERSLSFCMDADGCVASIDDLKCTVSSSYISNDGASVTHEQDLKNQFTMKRLDRCHRFSLINYEVDPDISTTQQKKLTKMLSNSERLGLTWPEQPLNLLGSRGLNRPNSFKSVKSFRASSSFKSALEECKDLSNISTTQQKKLTKMLSSSERLGLTWPEQPLNLLASHGLDHPNSFKSVKPFGASSSFKSAHEECKDLSEFYLIPNLNMDAVLSKKKRSPFVKIISKQMIGIFLSIWVRRGLRKHIQNLKISTVGVGAMGFIGNKGSISVSMSIYQTLFCFVCSHLSSGEKSGDELRRNADVQEIHRRTHFSTVPTMGLPKAIRDHERIFWFGDLNYRIDLSYDKTHELISKKDWSKLLERDQLKRELKKGRVFDGWSEGVLNFPPTYKYEYSSSKYIGEDPKVGRRTPAWCDRILSFGKGIKLLRYKRTEQRLSDHRPVTAIFTSEVEIFCHRKLQRALTLTNAEIEDGDIISDMETDDRLGHLDIGEEISEWAH